MASEGLAAPGGFVLGHGAAYITNNGGAAARARPLLWLQ
jgi:hypothetical protein